MINWISIYDRLPTHSDLILLTDGKNVYTGEFWTGTKEFVGGSGSNECDWDPESTVTHRAEIDLPDER